MATPEDVAAKREFIAAYFEDLERKVAFLLTLAEQGHEDEARLLCLVYIDGVANWLNFPNANSPRNFSRALMQHGNDEFFSLVLPQWLLKAVPWNSAPAGLEAALTAAISALPPNEAYQPTEFLDALRQYLNAAQLEWLETELWRGSIANAAYVALRSPGVHELGASHGLSFPNTFRGHALPRIDLHTLHPALVSLVAHAKRVSEATGDWFGVQ
jgi:hypothetical protein